MVEAHCLFTFGGSPHSDMSVEGKWFLNCLIGISVVADGQNKFTPSLRDSWRSRRWHLSSPSPFVWLPQEEGEDRLICKSKTLQTSTSAFHNPDLSHSSSSHSSSTDSDQTVRPSSPLRDMTTLENSLILLVIWFSHKPSVFTTREGGKRFYILHT